MGGTEGADEGGSELRPCVQRAPNPVRGPDGGAAAALCFPQVLGGYGVEAVELRRQGKMVVWWVLSWCRP